MHAESLSVPGGRVSGWRVFVRAHPNAVAGALTTFATLAALLALGW